MSFLEDLAKQALGGALGGQQQQQPGGGGTESQLLQMAAGILQQQGGVQGLMAKFQQAGLGDKIASWVSSGHNLPISAEEIKSVLGSHVDQAAQQTGQDPNAVAGGLASLLPSLIDKLTPHGQPVDGEATQSGLASLLEGGLGKLFR